MIDVKETKVVLSEQSDDDSQRWWFERGMIWNKAHPGKVLAVDWNHETSRPEGKLADLHLVVEDHTAANQRWIYFLKDEVFESGVDGRYIIDCWHANKKLRVGANVIAHIDWRKPEQRVLMKEDPLDKLKNVPNTGKFTNISVNQFLPISWVWENDF